VFALQWVLTMAAWAMMHLYTPIAGIPVALYAVSAYCTRTMSLVALLASFVPNLLCAAVAFRLSSDPAQRLHQFTANAIVLVAVTLGAWAAGRVTLRRVDATRGFGWPDDRSPFPGLRPFEIDQHCIFFDRKSETEELARPLRSFTEQAKAAVLVVVGPSGCGSLS
jgi:hypothetical protein